MIENICVVIFLPVLYEVISSKEKLKEKERKVGKSIKANGARHTDTRETSKIDIHTDG